MTELFSISEKNINMVEHHLNKALPEDLKPLNRDIIENSIKRVYSMYCDTDVKKIAFNSILNNIKYKLLFIENDDIRVSNQRIIQIKNKFIMYLKSFYMVLSKNNTNLKDILTVVGCNTHLKNCMTRYFKKYNLEPNVYNFLNASSDDLYNIMNFGKESYVHYLKICSILKSMNL